MRGLEPYKTIPAPHSEQLVTWAEWELFVDCPAAYLPQDTQARSAISIISWGKKMDLQANSLSLHPPSSSWKNPDLHLGPLCLITIWQILQGCHLMLAFLCQPQSVC